jgi:hypothetical protein
MNKVTTIIIIIIITLFLGFASNSFAGDKKHSAVTGNFYYDIATGHKYIKNPGTNTYMEYSQRGELLRGGVSNNIPLLVTNKYIREMKRDHYLLYQKVNYQRKELMVLPADQNHPNGWTCKKLLIVMD